jgi:hypothetical protein
MTEYTKKLLYVGAGTHIEPVKHFPKTKLFIFIDTQPRSEFDTYNPKFCKEFYRPHFLYELETTCEIYGFKLESFSCIDKDYYKQIIPWRWYYSSWFFKIPNYVNPFLLVFKNYKTQQTLKYYISTNIKFNINPQIIKDIETSDGIMVSGYLPDIDILKYFGSSKIFFGYTKSCYDDTNKTEFNEKYNNNIIHFLHKFVCNSHYYFYDFYLVKYYTGEIIHCNNFEYFYDLSKKILQDEINEINI